MTDQFGRTITATDNGDGTTTYSTTGISITQASDAPAAAIIAIFNGMSPSISVLPVEMQQKLTKFRASMDDFVSTKYDLETRVRLLILYQTASEDGLLARKAYIRQLLTWVDSVIAYSAAFVAQVQEQTDATTLSQLQWDFSALELSDPKVTVLGAISIST